MKKIFLISVLAFVAVLGVQVEKVHAGYCTFSSATISPTSGVAGDPVTISWSSTGCSIIEILDQSGGIVHTANYLQSGPGTVSEPSSGSTSPVGSGDNLHAGQVPTYFTVKAYGNFCSFEDEQETGGSTYAVKYCDSKSVAFSALPATVSVNNVCTVGSGTMSPGGMTISPSSNPSWTVTPSSNGTTYTPSYTASGQTVTIIPLSHSVTPGNSYSFSITCTQDPDPTINIKANGSDGPISVNVGSSASLNWGSTEAVSCTAFGSWSGSKAVSGTESTGVLSAGQKTYTITCQNASGATATDSVTVNVTGSATVTVSASPNPITSGQSSTLTWSSTNASSCSAWWAPSTLTSGSVSVSPSVTTTYSMTCTGNTGYADGTGSDTITVNQPVGNPPVVTISASPTSGLAGTVAPQLTWSVTNSPTSCTASASPANTNWSGAKASSGSQVSVGTLNTIGSHGFTLSCSNSAGSSLGTAYVTVEPSTGIRVFSSLSGGSWTVSGPTPFSGSGTGGAWVAVTPGTYSLSAGSVANYTSSVTGTDNTGNTLVIATGNRKDFNVSYTPIGGDSWDYSLTNTGPVTTTQGGGLYNVVVNRNVVSGTQEAVTLAVSGLPTGVTVSGTTNATATAPQSSTITFNVSSSAQVGTHSVTVTGTTADSITRTTTVSLVVNPANSLSVSCSASPSPAEVGKQVVWTASPLGGDGNYTYSWTGTNFPAPAPSGRTYAIIYQTTGSKTAQVTVRDAGGVGATAQCATAQLQVNAKIKPQEF